MLPVLVYRARGLHGAQPRLQERDLLLDRREAVRDVNGAGARSDFRERRRTARRREHDDDVLGGVDHAQPRAGLGHLDPRGSGDRDRLAESVVIRSRADLRVQAGRGPAEGRLRRCDNVRAMNDRVRGDGDTSSLDALYQMTGNPIMIQNIEK